MVRFSRWLSALFAATLVLTAGAALAQGRPPAGPGGMCGGIGGFQCQGGLVCVMKGQRFPDQAGVCEAPRGGDGGGRTVCPQIYQPVCGADGRTYPNRCIAESRGARVAYPGQCQAAPPAPPPQVCSDIYRPVCGRDGQTYPNRCTARANGVGVRHAGQCRGRPHGGPQGWTDGPPTYGLPPQPMPYSSYPPPAPQPYGERG